MDNDVRLKLNNIVQMYLIDGEFKETSEVFRAECQKLGETCKGNSYDNQNQKYLQLECHLQLHFAVFGLTDLNDEAVAKLKLESGMQEFKQYLGKSRISFEYYKRR
ncbi:hypothetical protein CHUAL_007869 [Chamberlinius hualienensis]